MIGSYGYAPTMDRSKQIPPLVEEGLSRYQIADRLGIAPGTVQYWLKKLGLRTRTPPVGSRPPIEDLTGQRFGHQVVVRMERLPRGEWAAVCKCDCGSDERVVRRHALIRNMSTSCGCRRDQYAKLRGRNSANYTGYCGLPGKFWKKLVRRARRYGKLKLTIKAAWELFEEQERRCALTGLPITFGRAEHPEETTASLDRIDSSKGYEPGNVQWVHKDVNLMKGSLSVEDLLHYCQLIVEHVGD